MSNVVVQASFAAGELAPQFRGRVDQTRYKIGSATMRNFFVDYRGGASNRSGTEFLAFAANSDYAVRLIKFSFSTVQNYVLEFGHLYMRVIRDGGYVLETSQAITGMTNANPGVFTAPGNGYVNGDVVYLAGSGLDPLLRAKTCTVFAAAVNTFSLYDVNGDPVDTSTMTAYTTGGTVSRYYKLTTPYSGADLNLLKFTQSADVLTLTHPSYVPQDLTRTGNTTWTLTDAVFETTAITPTGLTGTASDTTAPLYSYGYRVTSINSDNEESFPSSRVVVNSKDGFPISLSWSVVPGASFYAVYKSTPGDDEATGGMGAGGTGGIAIGAAYGYMTTVQGNFANDTNTTPDFTKQPPLNFNPFAPGKITKVTITAGGAGYTSQPAVTITDPTGSGFVAEAIINAGALVAIIINKPGRDYSNPTVVITGGAGAGATATAEFGSLTGTYPSCVTYFQQRKYYGSTLNQPATFWASKPGQYDNFDYANPIGSGDSISYTLASQEVNNIKAMLAMPGGLVMFTGGAVWQISGQGVNAPVTPTSAIANPQSYTGCSDVPPIAINFNILYVQSKGSIVRELTYNFFANIYTGTDITVFSNHLFYRRGQVVELIEWAYAQEPYKVVWGVQENGRMLSLTYIKDQELLGWARHDTFGYFKSVTVVSENSVDVPYFVVERRLNGRYVKCIERMAEREFPNGVEDAWFVDCALATEPTVQTVGLTMSAVSGLVVCTTDGAVTAAVGNIVRVAGGYGIVTQVTSSTVFVANFLTAATNVLPNDPTNTPVPVLSGEWSLTTPFTTIYGLEHLEGATVSILADGNVQPQQVVVNGTITLENPSTKVLVGLGFQSQLQTLQLDIGDPSIQGKRKSISAVTTKVVDTRGLNIGPTFDSVTPYRQFGPTYYGIPQPLLTGDQRVIMSPLWSVAGQVCIQQDDPLPITVLSVANEVTLGDT